MLIILMALLCSGEYKVLGQGPGSTLGAVLVRRGQSLTMASFAGLCTGARAEEIGEFFPCSRLGHSFLEIRNNYRVSVSVPRE